MVLIFKVLGILFLLGLLQAIMQGLMFYNSLRFLDGYLPVGIKWFGGGADNKNKWNINLFGRKVYAFKWFPFIMFTDFFHFCHGMFGLFLGVLTSWCLVPNESPTAIYVFVSSALVYGTSFHFNLLLMKKISKWNQ